MLSLAADGATLPFIVRYRKEQTGNLDEVAVRAVLDVRELFERIVSRQTIILDSIERHATLTPELRERILATFDLDVLEDLYHPYRQQKKNRAREAREAGLGPLADWIWNCGHGTRDAAGGPDARAVGLHLPQRGEGDHRRQGRDRGRPRHPGRAPRRANPSCARWCGAAYFEQGFVRATKADKAKPHSKFEPYFAFQESVTSLREPGEPRTATSPLRRGQSEAELQLAVGGPAEDAEFDARLQAAFEARACTVPESPGAEVLRHAGRIAFRNHVRTAIENEVHRVLKDAADATAAQVFAENVRRLLLEPPLRPEGRCSASIPASAPAASWPRSTRAGLQGDRGRPPAERTSRRPPRARRVLRLARERGRAGGRVGNGTGGREAEVFARQALREAGLDVPVVLVSEAGASVYSDERRRARRVPRASTPRCAARSRSRGGCRTRSPSW